MSGENRASKHHAFRMLNVSFFGLLYCVAARPIKWSIDRQSERSVLDDDRWLSCTNLLPYQKHFLQDAPAQQFCPFVQHIVTAWTKAKCAGLFLTLFSLILRDNTPIVTKGTKNELYSIIPRFSKAPNAIDDTAACTTTKVTTPMF